MNYKWAFIVELEDGKRDYLRKSDFEALEIDQEEHRYHFHPETRVVWTEEDVNTRNTDKLVELLEEKGVNARLRSTLLDKEFSEEFLQNHCQNA